MRALPKVLINGRVSAPRRSVPADLSAPGILSMAFHGGAAKGGIKPCGQLREAEGEGGDAVRVHPLARSRKSRETNRHRLHARMDRLSFA